VKERHFRRNLDRSDENASLSLVGFCHQSEVAVMAYCPLASGWCPAKGKLLQHPTLAEIASQHGKTPAQVALKWVMDRGTIIIPKSGSKVRLGQNIRILDFELSWDQTAQLNEL
jgi:diketogulonate reductase-like aldo/keto reductase